MTPGPLALVGSGEYLPQMSELEGELISGRSPIYLQIPTAAAPEGEQVLDYWAKLGAEQAKRLGVTARELRIRNVQEANDPILAQQVSSAGLIYLSGGSPSHLANSLRGSLVLSAIVDAWHSGAALAGCSAGAMALADHIPALRSKQAPSTRGFGVVQDTMVLPHFDRMFFRGAKLAAEYQGAAKVILGIDELTALVRTQDSWQVHGAGKVHLFRDSTHTEFAAGESLIF